MPNDNGRERSGLQRSAYGAGAALSGAGGLGALSAATRMDDVLAEMSRQDKLRDLIFRQSQFDGGTPEVRRTLKQTGDAYSNAIRQVFSRLPESVARPASSVLHGTEAVSWSGVPRKNLTTLDQILPGIRHFASPGTIGQPHFLDKFYSSKAHAAGAVDAFRRSGLQGQAHLQPLIQGRGAGVLLSEMLTGLPASGQGRFNPGDAGRKIDTMSKWLSRIGVDLTDLTDDASHDPFSKRLQGLFDKIDEAKASGDRTQRSIARAIESRLRRMHQNLYSTAPSAPGAYALNWDALTGRNKDVANLAKKLRTAGRGVAGLGALGAGLLGYKALTKEGQFTPTDTQYNLAGGAGAASTAGLIRHLMSNSLDARRYNPWSKADPRVLLTGGWHEPGAGSSSFTTQRGGLAKALRAHLGAENIKEVSGWGDDILSLEPQQRLAAADRHAQIRRGMLPRYDAHIQVGNNLRDWATGNRLRDRVLDKLMYAPQYRGMLRARLLTDLAEGNLVTPSVEWTGRPSGMAARGAIPYDQVYVSGVPEEKLPAFAKKWGIRGQAVGTPTLFNDPGPFRGVKYAPGSGGPVTALSTGGGAGRPLLFQDVLREGSTPLAQTFDPSRRNVLDDILEAHRKVHGPAGRVEWHTGAPMVGGKLKLPANPATGMADPIQEVFEFIQKNPERFKGLELVPRVTRADLAKRMAAAQNIVALPGSTYAELSAMGGENLPRIVSLIPDDLKPDSAKHFRPNSRAFAGMGLGDISEVNLLDESKARIKSMADAFSKGTQNLPGRTPVEADASGIVEALRRGVKRVRARNLLSALGLAGAGAAGLGLYATKPTEKAASQVSVVRNLAAALPRLSEGAVAPALGSAALVGPSVGIATDDVDRGLQSALAAGSFGAGLHIAPRAGGLEMQRAAGGSGDFIHLLRRRGFPVAGGVLAASLIPAALMGASEARKLSLKKKTPAVLQPVAGPRDSAKEELSAFIDKLKGLVKRDR